MKQEKFNISIEREVLRLNQKAQIKAFSYPKAFGNKEKNNFIKVTGNSENVLTIKTPVETTISEVYNKLEEITNVVYVELYNQKEIIWPFSSFNELNLSNKITLSIDKEFYNEIKEVNNNLPENIEEAYKNLKKQFNSKIELYENIFGKCTLKISKNNIEISNIKPNYKNRMTITEAQLLFLVILVFGLLENVEANTLAEMSKHLTKIAKKYLLKSVDSIKEITSLVKDKTNLSEEKLANEEKIEIANKYMEEGYGTRYGMKKYTKLVSACVCIIKDAISQGIDYKILNELKSVVEFNYNGHKEFVIEGNKTDRDNYIFPIITDDKFIAKSIMQEAGLNVPKAILLDKTMDQDDIENLVSPFYNQTLVVKPRNTNYGTGITVFSKKASKKQILNAIEYAFKFDDNILIEEFVKGMEYRFLVVDGKCLSIVHRRAASVIGDGKSTIRELMLIKNQEPWHVLTGCPMKMDEPVNEYLKLSGLTLDSIPPAGKRITLRSNSNGSTGGETIDFTAEVPARFKRIAEKAAKAFDAKISGVDIIIDDFKKEDYSIIEINDNPGYSINEWPYEPNEGKGVKIGLDILRLLGYEV